MSRDDWAEALDDAAREAEIRRSTAARFDDPRVQEADISNDRAFEEVADGRTTVAAGARPVSDRRRD